MNVSSTARLDTAPRTDSFRQLEDKFERLGAVAAVLEDAFVGTYDSDEESGTAQSPCTSEVIAYYDGEMLPEGSFGSFQ